MPDIKHITNGEAERKIFDHHRKKHGKAVAKAKLVELQEKRDGGGRSSAMTMTFDHKPTKEEIQEKIAEMRANN